MKQDHQAKHKTVPKITVRKTVKKQHDFNSWLPWVVAALLLILTWFLYKPSLNNHFTNWDDNLYVLDNAQVKQHGYQNTKYFFTHASAGNYHPLTMLSLSFDYRLAEQDKRLVNEIPEPDAEIFHTTSLILHVINVLLVFVFIYLLSRKRLIVASVTALLFAIHPMHVESVAWVAERKDVLYAFFFLAGLIVYMKYLEKTSWWRLLITGLLFLASLFSKPSAVVFPLILLAVDFFYGRKFTARVFLEKLPFFILAVIFGVITSIIQGNLAASGIKVFSLFQRLMFSSYGFITYQYKLLLPLKISAYYPYPGITSAGNLPLIYYLSPLISLAIIGLVFYSIRFTKVIGFGYLFYFFSIALVLQFIPVGNAIMADRYSYISAIGLFFILAWYLDQAFVSKDKILRSLRWILAGACLVYCIFLGKTTFEQTMVWNNSETLWTDVISKYPETYVAYKHRGNYYRSLNIFDKAMKDYLIYTQIRQDDAGVYNNLGNVYRLRNEPEKAIDAYSKSISIDSLDPKTWLNRAVIYSKTKQYASAVKDFNKALSLNIGIMEIYTSRSVMFREMGRYEDAIADLSLLIRNDPNNDKYFIDRGVCHYNLKQFPEAITDFEKCIALNPVDGHAYFNMSAAYNELKDYRKAYQCALKAITLNYPVDKNYLETLKKKGG